MKLLKKIVNWFKVRKRKKLIEDLVTKMCKEIRIKEDNFILKELQELSEKSKLLK